MLLVVNKVMTVSEGC